MPGLFTGCQPIGGQAPLETKDSTSRQVETHRVDRAEKDDAKGAVDTSPPRLPQGSGGLAADYAGDIGLAEDAQVILFDGFESYHQTSDLWNGYENFYQQHNCTIETDGANVFSGDQSLEMVLPELNRPEYNAITKHISPHDTIFVRFYTKLENGFSFTTGSAVHNGVDISGGYDNPGGIPDGTDFFYVGLENTEYRGEGQPGYTHAYVYHTGQRSGWGDHWYADGLVIPGETPGNFGSDFVSRPPNIPETGEWYSVELMVQLNAPGVADGRVAAWIDGELIADWGNVNFRDTADLKIDRIQLNLGASLNTDGVDRQWFDNLVVANAYVGPMAIKSSDAGEPRIAPSSGMTTSFDSHGVLRSSSKSTYYTEH